MKKLLFLLMLSFVLVSLGGCSQKPKLLFLNWGEYINDEAVRLFEEEYGVNVVIDIADSNELFYSKIISGTTAYDLVCPSDYMIEKMYLKGLLQEIDLSRLANYNLVSNPFMPGVIGIQSQMFEGNESYGIPYFWGTFGLMYNKRKAGLEEAITTYGWQAYFDDAYLPQDTRVGMYDVPRFAYAAAMFYNHLSPNLATAESLELAQTTLSMRQYDEWGDDTLKKGISAGNLDLAFVYTGDFLDALYIQLGDDPDINNVLFDIYIPEETIAFVDELVIPKQARHVDLAYKFMDFFLRPEIAYLNASVVGYCTPLTLAYDQIVDEDYSNEEDPVWAATWAYATNKYYPKPSPLDPVQYKGTPIANLHRNFLKEINTMVSNVKALG